MQQHEKEEKALFQIGWSIVGILTIIYITYKIAPFSFFKNPTPCLVHSLLGIYCPGCGGTRAIFALLHGHLLTSFICHPFVPYTAAICGWFLISQTIERASSHRIKIGMHYRDIYLWIALGIVIVNFIVKNALLLLWDIDILTNYTLSVI